MKKILGLDLGTNSIGWAIIEKEDNKGRIIKSGSRIIPMDAATLGDFASGNTKSQTAERTSKRTARRMRERFLLRRERLHRLLHLLGFLPKHYEERIGWDLDNDRKHYGTFLDGEEPKIAWRKDENKKYRFLFQSSFQEMLEDFKERYPNIVSDDKKIPYDWTIYYLRQKALSQQISKEELAWIILNFNQKRGYNQQRDEVLEASDDKKEEFMCLTVSSVTPDENAKGKDIWYNICFENSEIIYRRKSKYPLNWVGKKRNLIVTTKLDEEGNPKLKKDGSIDYSVKSPNEDDWALMKIKTEQNLKDSHKTVGQYVYSALLSNPSEKIRGGLVRTIERNFYEEELEKILIKQKEYHAELNDRKLYEQCINELYRNNDAHRNNIAKNDFTFLILEDVLFYQRPLKSKKSLIDNCPYESHLGVDNETGEICTYPLKCIAKSNPYFQEYRVWKFLSDLRIIANTKEINGHIQTDVDITSELLPDNESWSKLFVWLNDKGHITQSEMLAYLGIKKKDQGKYRWNYVADKHYPMNATRHAILNRMKDGEILSRELEQAIWHILYSTISKAEIDKSLSPSDKLNGIYTSLVKAGFSQESIEKIKNIKLPDEGYGSYSEKAIKKLLSLMRCGQQWNENNLHSTICNRIGEFMQGKGLEQFSDKVKQLISSMGDIHQFQRLPEWLACYVVYGKHSEAQEIVKWKTPNDINVYLNNFKQHSLRNPIVESVILETLRVVRDIWKRFGNIDEIHVEMGRDLKNPSDKRAQITQRVLQNENTNIRIKALLAEFLAEEYKIANVRPHSPSQLDLLRIYEEDVLAHNEPNEEIKDIINNLSNPTKQPSRAQVLRYKCWLDQKYCSPYTGQPIPLSRLFTPDYEIEHIIPQSRYFDDSFSNKVICESEVNKLKDNQLGYEFIKQHHGQTVQLSSGRMVRVLEVNQYEQLVKDNFVQSKRRKLLMDDIPTEFIQRQLNDSRYISKVVKSLLSNIVRTTDEDGNLESEAISKNVITCNGSVTTRLKRDWGLGEVWNAIVLPRFRRLNELTGRDCFTATNSHGQEIPAMPLELQKGFSIKRIDHRHHALDAIVIACTTRDHVNLLNNESALPENQTNKHALSRKLRACEEIVINGKKRTVYKEFLMPWNQFKSDTYNSLQEIIVSFKQNLRILTQATNLFTKYVDGEKKQESQHSADHYAIRKSLHKDTVYGHVNLQRITTVPLKDALKNVNRIVDKPLKKKIKELINAHFNEKQLLIHFKDYAYEWRGYDFKKVKVFYFTDEKEMMVATRFCNDLVSVFSGKSKKQDVEKAIVQITDTGIQTILTNYLNENLDQIEFAFSAEGLEKMNDNIAAYNNGKQHKPIYKVRLFEPKGKKFQIGQSGNNSNKFVVADDGTNLFFAVYKNKDGERKYKTIPLEEVVARMKLKLHPVNDTDEEGNKLLFYISPNDMVYLPTPDELANGYVNLESIDANRVYRFVDSSGTTANFVPAKIAKVVYHQKKDQAERFCNGAIIQDELGKGSPQSKNQKAITGEMVKDSCIPLVVNRIGEIKLK